MSRLRRNSTGRGGAPDWVPIAAGGKPLGSCCLSSFLLLSGVLLSLSLLGRGAMHQEVLGFNEFHERVPVFMKVLLVLPGLQNCALVAHFGPVSEVLLNLGLDLPVPEGTLSVLGFADLSRNTAPKEAVGLAENLVFSRFVLVSNKAEGLCPARHKPEPTHLPKPLEILQKGFFGGLFW